jgi:hypothetical protein
MIRLIFLKVVTTSWLRKESTPELGSSHHHVDVDVDADEDEEE